MVLLGILGSVLLLIAWINEVYKLHTAKNVEAISMKFLMLYLVGSVILLAHAWLINDLGFVFLQVSVTIITLVEIGIVMHRRALRSMKKVRKPRRR